MLLVLPGKEFAFWQYQEQITGSHIQRLHCSFTFW